MLALKLCRYTDLSLDAKPFAIIRQRHIFHHQTRVSVNLASLTKQNLLMKLNIV